MDKAKVKEVLIMIASDMEKDAARFEGLPFSGRNVAEYMGNLGAAVATLAIIIHKMLEEDDV